MCQVQLSLGTPTNLPEVLPGVRSSLPANNSFVPHPFQLTIHHHEVCVTSGVIT
jgi:hypothetical protein